ncbi:MAG: aminoacyl-tRNA hydrolase [Phycisphaerae bacterium]|nr:aminoacyl-tRNA hydrolase [Phycisphaerae bacterium]
MRINSQTIISDSELWFTFITSSGPGGQNVNKVATRANLHFDVANSRSLTDSAKQRVLAALGDRIDSSGVLHISASRYRSQSANKEDAIRRFVNLLAEALKPRKLRRPTRPTRASQERRLTQKRRSSDRKSARRPPSRNDD